MEGTVLHPVLCSLLLTACLALPLTLPAQAIPSAQACGGNSTVDAMGAQTANAARAFLAELQKAVESNDKERIAGMVAYPLLVLPSGKRMRIRQKRVFLADYDQIFTTSVRDAILRQTSQCLFGNDMGAMVGTGEIWFRAQPGGQMKIVTVNPSAPSH